MGVTIDEIKKMVNESENKSTIKAKSKSYKVTKILIVGIVVFLAFIGFLGSTHWGMFKDFNMLDFTNFLDSYGGIFMTLIASIGLGGAAKNGISALADYKKALKGLRSKPKRDNKQDDDGEDLVKGGA